MTPWGEKPGGFSGMGGYGGDSGWLSNAKRQSLFRQAIGPISWAGKPNTPGMMAPQASGGMQPAQTMQATQPAMSASAVSRQYGAPTPANHIFTGGGPAVNEDGRPDVFEANGDAIRAFHLRSLFR